MAEQLGQGINSLDHKIEHFAERSQERELQEGISVAHRKILELAENVDKLGKAALGGVGQLKQELVRSQSHMLQEMEKVHPDEKKVTKNVNCNKAP